MAHKKRWRRKSGSHSAIIGGKRQKVNPGDIIEAFENELHGFLDSYECLDPPEPAPQEEMPSIGLKIFHHGSGWYDVINEATGEPINDRKLRKAEAEALVHGRVAVPEDMAGSDGLHPGRGTEPDAGEPELDPE